MIGATNSYDDIIRAVRPIILREAGLSNERLLDAYTVRGPELEKIITDSSTGTYNLNDLFIIFELFPNTDTEDFASIPQEDGSVNIVAPYIMTLKLYGNQALNMSYTLIGRLRSASILDQFQASGVYLKTISPPTQVTEFINNTVWPRHDLRMSLDVYFHILPNEEIPEILHADNLKIRTFSGMESP